MQPLSRTSSLLSLLDDWEEAVAGNVKLWRRSGLPVESAGQQVHHHKVHLGHLDDLVPLGGKRKKNRIDIIYFRSMQMLTSRFVSL